MVRKISNSRNKFYSIPVHMFEVIDGLTGNFYHIWIVPASLNPCRYVNNAL